MGLFYDQSRIDMIHESILNDVFEEKYDRYVKAKIKINSNDLNKIRSMLFENIEKKDPKLKRHVYIDNKHKKELSGIYICTYSTVDKEYDTEAVMKRFLEYFMVQLPPVFSTSVVLTNHNIDINMRCKTEKHADDVIIDDKYKLVVINDPASIYNYILLAVPKDFKL